MACAVVGRTWAGWATAIAAAAAVAAAVFVDAAEQVRPGCCRGVWALQAESDQGNTCTHRHRLQRDFLHAAGHRACSIGTPYTPPFNPFMLPLG